MTVEEQYRGLVEHECGHAAAALMLGLQVKRIEANVTPESQFDEMAVKVATTGRLPDDMDEPAGGTWVEVDALGEIETRAAAAMTLVGRMVEQDDRGNEWPPSYVDLIRPTGWVSSDHRQLAEHVKSLGLGELGYQRLIGEALRLACSSEFTDLHDELVTALHRSGGHLDERAILEVRAKARKPQPQPPEDGDRDVDGVISDAQANSDIDAISGARAIAGNGNVDAVVSISKGLVDIKGATEKFEQRLDKALTFACRC